MSKLKIYYAGPLKAANPPDITRNDLNLRLLNSLGEVLTNLKDPKLMGQGEVNLEDTYIYERNMKRMKECDVLFADVTSHSQGVSVEVMKAMEINKPIVMIYSNKDAQRLLSPMLTGTGYKNIVIIKFDDYSEVEVGTKKFLFNV